jgi:hypothetical protein
MVRVSENFLEQITVLAKDGYGEVNAFGAVIKNAAYPDDPNDLATKQYVDDNSGGGGGDSDSVTNLSAVTGANVTNALDNLLSGKANSAVILTAGNGLTGGGDLTANRTFDVVANADGSIVANANDIQVGVLATDGQHGNRGGGALHAVATTSVAGFMSSTDKLKLDGVASGATNTALTAAAPVNVTKSAAVVGVATTAARADHKHDVTTASPSTLAVGGSNAEGASTSLARADHVHALPAFGTTAGTFAEGNDSRFSDDRDPLAHAITHESGGSDEIDGYQLQFAFSPMNYTEPENDLLGEHISNIDARLGNLASQTHGDLGGGPLHAVVTTTINGFMSASDKVKLDGIATGATNTPLTASAPVNVTKSAAVVGVATSAARADHKHDVATAAAVALTVGIANAEGVSTSLARADHTHAIASAVPVSIGTANAEGAGTTFARSNHVHAHGDQTVGTLHAAVTTSVNGFMLATDKVKLDGIAASATNTPLTASAPVNVTKSAAVVGVATDAARADHKHDVATAAAVALTVGIANAEGVSTSLSRADHTHAIAAGTPVSIGTANAEGAGTTFARSNHVHAHGDQTVGTLHAAATTSVNGFMSSTDKVKLDGIATGATNTPLTAAAPVNVTKAAAVVGVATAAARADHKHDVATAAAVALTVGISNAEGVSTSLSRADHTHAIASAAPVAIGTANAEGAATTFARSNHVHAHGDQTSGTLHAVATTSVAGFMSAADKVKLDGFPDDGYGLPDTLSVDNNTGPNSINFTNGSGITVASGNDLVVGLDGGSFVINDTDDVVSISGSETSFDYSTAGLVLRAWTAASSVTALYAGGVTPGSSNHALFISDDSGTNALNAQTSCIMQINGATKILASADSARFSYSAEGLVLRAWTAASSVTALYAGGVTPGNNNHALFISDDSSTNALNAQTSCIMQINGVTRVIASASEISLTSVDNIFLRPNITNRVTVSDIETEINYASGLVFREINGNTIGVYSGTVTPSATNYAFLSTDSNIQTRVNSTGDTTLSVDGYRRVTGGIDWVWLTPTTVTRVDVTDDDTTFNYSTAGLRIREWTGGSNISAFYPGGVTPGNTNHSLLISDTGGTAILNAQSTCITEIIGVAKFAITNTEAIVEQIPVRLRNTSSIPSAVASSAIAFALEGAFIIREASGNIIAV